VERVVEKKTGTSACVQISTKDGRTLKLLFSTEDKQVPFEEIVKRIEKMAFPRDSKELFAFHHKWPNRDVEGWNLFADIDEYAQMGLLYEGKDTFVVKDRKDAPFRLFADNVEGSTCPSYPQRVIVPTGMTDPEVVDCSKFRTKERFPVLTYYYAGLGSSIWRSSQPKVRRWGENVGGIVQQLQ
jgi:myotubularin-related protein 6/7/8